MSDYDNAGFEFPAFLAKLTTTELSQIQDAKLGTTTVLSGTCDTAIMVNENQLCVDSKIPSDGGSMYGRTPGRVIPSSDCLTSHYEVEGEMTFTLMVELIYFGVPVLTFCVNQDSAIAM